MHRVNRQTLELCVRRRTGAHSTSSHNNANEPWLWPAAPPRKGCASAALPPGRLLPLHTSATGLSSRLPATPVRVARSTIYDIQVKEPTRGVVLKGCL